jgi:RNA polymerase sigma factor (TIGR02999 family)
MGESEREITRLLSAIDEGKDFSSNQLFGLVYDELRRRAGQLMNAERRDHTLQPTALVNEAFLKVARPGVSFQSKLHFYNAASLAMRRILVDHAKAREASKRGGGGGGTWREMSLSDVGEAQQQTVDVVALDEALDKLAQVAPRQARVVELRFFGGLSEAETAELLDVNPKTVRRDWAAARVWLHAEMTG